MIAKVIREKDRPDFREFVASLFSGEMRFLLKNDIMLAYEKYCAERGRPESFRAKSSLAEFFGQVQELFILDGRIAVMQRHAIARYRFYLMGADGGHMEEVGIREYLDLKDRYILGGEKDGRHLHLDMQPFYDYMPAMRDTKSIGNGIRFLNRFMCSKIFQDHREWDEKLFGFIKMHRYRDRQLLVNGDIIRDFGSFMEGLEKMIDYLEARKRDEAWSAVEGRLRKAGFERGWGNTAGRALDTMKMLVDLVNEPTDEQFEDFITRVPMPLVSKIAIISPHGWVGQENVLGRPDTGGQVIYILDQVRALERYLRHEIREAGLDVEPQLIVLTRLIPEAGNTACGQKKEKIHRTENSWILRIPFRDDSYNVRREWIPRFHVWPYLENFADDAAREITAEFEGRPDLIIGNYSDGNIVATMLSDKLDVIQCTIAHALEKTKYLFSDLYWRDMEHDYNFSLQFTADILAMNKADFIITSTYQEIAGTENSMGQYESYQFFTMPGLYQVVSGVNIYAPKFNVIPPGVDQEMYFPFGEHERRVHHHTERLEARLFTDDSPDLFGKLDEPGKPPIFTMARFDKIKNITGLIEAFGMSQWLRKRYNLVFAAGTTRLEESHDAEERDQISMAYELIDKYGLQGLVRWLPGIEKSDTGEVYRIIAGRKGVFVQPALFEAFGLTILEAMVSGLPTFGPRFGGPIEIIEDGVSGYLLNTSRPDLISRGLEKCLGMLESDSGLWDSISAGGIRRVNERFTWENYSDRLVNLTKLYGFWRYSVSGQGKVKMDRYCEVLHRCLFSERAARLG